MSYWTGVATLTGIYMIAMLGMSILTGFTGLFSMKKSAICRGRKNKDDRASAKGAV